MFPFFLNLNELILVVVIQLSLKLSSKFAALFPQFEKTVDVPGKMEIVSEMLSLNFGIAFTPTSLKLTFESLVLVFDTLLTTERKPAVLKMMSTMEFPLNFRRMVVVN
jgi:hypothetical protein